MPNEELRLQFRRITEQGDTYSPHCKRRGNIMQVQIWPIQDMNSENIPIHYSQHIVAPHNKLHT